MTVFQPRAERPVIKVEDIAWLRFGRSDLDQAERYFVDFGLQVSARTADAIYLRGVLAAHHVVIIERTEHDGFLSLGLRASSAADLATLAQTHGEQVCASTEPGGGQIVRLEDPSGMRVEVVHGLAELPVLPHRPPRAWNMPGDKRRVNAPQPCIAAPAEVFRLGHLVMQRQEFARNANWYVQNFGLIASDVEVLPATREAVIAFLRCDRGSIPSDHHSLVIASGPRDQYDHAAFETLDLDAVALGGQWLQQRGWVHNWGIGRHVLGSQVFNYHYDPSGFPVEHYADGDVFDSHYPTRYHETGKGSMYQWGPDMPGHFIEARPSLSMLADVIRGLRTRPDFRLSRLAAIKKVFSLPPRSWAGRRFRKPRPR